MITKYKHYTTTINIISLVIMRSVKMHLFLKLSALCLGTYLRSFRGRLSYFKLIGISIEHK